MVKVTGFYVESGSMVSPTVFRKMALESIKKFNLGLIIPSSMTDKPDLIGVVKEEELITT